MMTFDVHLIACLGWADVATSFTLLLLYAYICDYFYDTKSALASRRRSVFFSLVTDVGILMHLALFVVGTICIDPQKCFGTCPEPGAIQLFGTTWIDALGTLLAVFVMSLRSEIDLPRSKTILRSTALATVTCVAFAHLVTCWIYRDMLLHLLSRITFDSVPFETHRDRFLVYPLSSVHALTVFAIVVGYCANPNRLTQLNVLLIGALLICYYPMRAVAVAF